ncbi:MAG: hypothetical protein JWM81_634 [Candidatus Saccharibacteria bacterium]|nr:hypothetical protein [Candidatus Saccharibacteria bacterium]
MKLLQKFRKASIAIGVVLLLLVQQSPLTQLMGSASAGNSITFTWQDQYTINVSGVVTGTLAVNRAATGNQASLSGGVKGPKGCNALGATVNFSGNKVNLLSKKSANAAPQGTVFCYYEDLQVASSVGISNGRPSTSGPRVETDTEKSVNISLGVPNRGSNPPPDNVTANITDASGRLVANPTAHISGGTSPADTSTPVLTSFTYRFAAFPLEAGNYTLTFTAVDITPHPFTKKQFEPFTQAYGSSDSYYPDEVLVQVRVNAPVSGGQQTVYSPISVDIRDVNATTIVQTIDLPVPDFAGGKTPADTGGSASATVLFQGTFSGIVPGHYLACVAETSTCKAFTKDSGKLANPSPVLIEGGDYQAIVGTQAKDEGSDCDNGAGSFGWLLCPIFDGVSGVSKFIFQTLIQPLLVTDPISTNPADERFRIWANFRIYGDIFLLLALIVVVFGQSIGGGIIDAYTAKKVLPRLLTAAILINLSIYIVAMLVDITNILGLGMSDLITSPVSQCAAGTVAGHTCWQFTVNGTQTVGILSLGIIGAFMGATSIAAAIFAIFTGTAGAFIGMAFFTILPILFAIIAVFATLVLRQGIIALLVIISPVAFALYCLPNTEQYFKKWWEALTKTLLVYPIVMVVFAVSSLLSILFLQSGGITPDNIIQKDTFANKSSTILAAIIGFALQFLPLFMIPFAFRLAGGIIGRVGAAALSAGAKVNNMGAIKSRREIKQDKWREGKSTAQERMHRSLAKTADGSTGVKSFAARRLASKTRTIGGRDITDVRAEYVAKEAKRQETTHNFGDNSRLRGLTVDLGFADSDQAVQSTDGKNGDWKYDEETGEKMYRSAGGAWLHRSDVVAGHKENGSNQSAIQAAMTFELSKATAPEDIAYYKENFGRLTQGRKTRTGASVMSGGQATGILKGASFTHQGTNRDLKAAKITNLDVNSRGGLQTNAAATLEEVVNTQNGYAAVQHNASVARTLTEGVEENNTIINYSEEQRQANNISEERYQEALKFRENAILQVASMRSAAMSPAPSGDMSGDDAGAFAAAAAARARAADPDDRELVTGGRPAAREVAAGGPARAQEEWNNFAIAVESNFGTHSFPSGAGVQQNTTRSGNGPPGEDPGAPSGGPQPTPDTPPQSDIDRQVENDTNNRYM